MKRTSVTTSLDPDFGTAGLAPLPGDMTQAVGITPLPDSTLLIAGASADGRFCLVKLLENGQLDSAFGRQGEIRDQLEAQQTAIGIKAYSVANNKTLVIYSTTSLEWPGFFPVVARYHNDGRLDQTFGSSGRRILSYPGTAKTASPVTSAAVVCRRNAITPSGQLVTSWWYPSHGRTVTFLLDAEGQLDPAFNGVGYVELSPSLGSGSVSATLILASGNTLVAGEYAASGKALPFLVRYTPTGTLDATFGNDGIVLLNAYIDCIFHQWVEQPNGGFVGFGRSGRERARLVAVHADGSPDDLFEDSPVDNVWQWMSGTLDNGRLIALGHTTNPHDVVVARYLDNGSLDLEFGDGKGWERFDLSDNQQEDTPYEVQVQAGRIVMAGSTTKPGLGQGFVVRLR